MTGLSDLFIFIKHNKKAWKTNQWRRRSSNVSNVSQNVDAECRLHLSSSPRPQTQASRPQRKSSAAVEIAVAPQLCREQRRTAEFLLSHRHISKWPILRQSDFVFFLFLFYHNRKQTIKKKRCLWLKITLTWRACNEAAIPSRQTAFNPEWLF